MSGTADHPPCPKCDPGILPDGYDPVRCDAVIERPDGEMTIVAGAVSVTVDGADVTPDAVEVDAARGVVVAMHGMVEGDEVRYHLCNRAGLDRFDPRLSEEKGGHLCHRVLAGDVRMLDTATGAAPVLATR